jgi:exopolyphosphatase/guanosine-5'-triphosphate,3'-diphosphate pyrophosphatase
MTRRRVGAIDVGTNTVLLLVAEGDASAPVAVAEHATITRLGAGVDRTGWLAADAVDRTLAALENYAGLLRRHGVDHVDAVCTSAARDAENGHEFLERATLVLGATPRIIDGKEEARLTFDGALTGLDIGGRVTVFDVGGGSTEIILGAPPGDLDDGASILASTSLDVGSVRLTERHMASDPPTLAELHAVRADVARALGTVSFRPTTKLVGVAGTVTTLSAIHQRLSLYDSSVVHGSRLSRSVVERIVSELAALPLDARRRVTGLPPARADVVVAGGIIVLAVLDFANAGELVVSDRGVRWGLARNALRS